MKRKNRNMTSAQLKEYFNNYHVYLNNIREHEATVTPTANISKYGEEAAIPRGEGYGDPTARAALDFLEGNSFISSRLLIVQAIGRWARHIKGHEQTEVLRYWLEGLTLVETGERMNFKKTKVGKIRDQIVQAILQGEGFTDR